MNLKTASVIRKKNKLVKKLKEKFGGGVKEEEEEDTQVQASLALTQGQGEDQKEEEREIVEGVKGE